MEVARSFSAAIQINDFARASCKRPFFVDHALCGNATLAASPFSEVSDLLWGAFPPNHTIVSVAERILVEINPLAKVRCLENSVNCRDFVSHYVRAVRPDLI